MLDFFNGFLLKIWTYTLVFPYASQGPLLKVSKGHIKVLGPWCSSCCISFSLTEFLTACLLAWLRSAYFFLYYYYYYFFLFPSFWDFGPSWSFLTSWIGPSFVKAHGLSLLFMEWAFLWNFGPQHIFISLLESIMILILR